MPEDLTHKEQRHGTATVLMAGCSVAAVLLVAGTFWALMPGPENGSPNQTEGPRPSATSGGFSNQGEGKSSVGLTHAGRAEEGTGSRARAIQEESEASSLDERKREPLRALFRGAQANRGEAEFTLSVGAAVPRQVTLQPLPSEASAILDGYVGNEYILVGDQLVIVDAQARRVVAILPGIG
jgi:hypothetical protein